MYLPHANVGYLHAPSATRRGSGHCPSHHFPLLTRASNPSKPDRVNFFLLLSPGVAEVGEREHGIVRHPCQALLHKLNPIVPPFEEPRQRTHPGSDAPRGSEAIDWDLGWDIR